MPNTILGAGDTEVSKRNKNPCLCGVSILLKADIINKLLGKI